MDINLSQLQQLIHIAENANIDELEVHDGEQTIRIVCHTTPTPTPTDTGLPPSNPAPPISYISSDPLIPTTATTPESLAELKSEPIAMGQNRINAPMIGTFYLRASPEATPFVAVNDSVTANQTLCIIEAMKIMHEVKAEKSGKITQILATEGEMVEHGQPLFIIE